jgi:hypothetical protein
MVANKKRCATCIEYNHEETLNSDEGYCWHMPKLIFNNDGTTLRPVVNAHKNYCDHWKDVGMHE